MKHALQALNYEKRKLINRLYEMQEENDFKRESHTDEDFQSVKRKIAQTDDAIKLIESNDKKPTGEIRSLGTKPVRRA